MIRKGNECQTINNVIFLKQRSHANHTMRGLHYPRLILEWLGFPLAFTQTLQVLASSCLPQQIFNFSSNLLTRFEKTAKEFASYGQTTRNTRKIANKLMTVASREINLQKQRSHMTSVAKEKAARSVHSMADVIPFSAYLIFPSNPTLR